MFRHWASDTDSDDDCTEMYRAMQEKERKAAEKEKAVQEQDDYEKSTVSDMDVKLNRKHGVERKRDRQQLVRSRVQAWKQWDKLHAIPGYTIGRWHLSHNNNDEQRNSIPSWLVLKVRYDGHNPLPTDKISAQLDCAKLMRLNSSYPKRPTTFRAWNAGDGYYRNQVWRFVGGRVFHGRRRSTQRKRFASNVDVELLSDLPRLNESSL